MSKSVRRLAANHFRRLVRGAAVALLPTVLTGLFWTAPVAAGEDLTRNEVFELQFRLDQMKLDAGWPDGVAGARTRNAIAAARSRLGLPSDAGPETLLAELRKATASMEGIILPDGREALLVFTDQGTPLILTVESFGRMTIDKFGQYVRDRDTDGSLLRSTRADVTIANSAAMPLEPRSAFGYKVDVPAPPRGERLAIMEVTTWPGNEQQADRSSGYEHVYLKSVSNPRYWWWQFNDDVSGARQGLWRMSLMNNGQELIARQIIIGKTDQ